MEVMGTWTEKFLYKFFLDIKPSLKFLLQSNTVLNLFFLFSD